MNKFADNFYFRFAVNGVGFRKFMPRDVQSGGLKLRDLRLHFGERKNGIKVSVRDQQPLRFGNRREVADQIFNVKNPAADADDACEPMRIMQAGFERHEAALRKTAERDLSGGKIFRAPIVQQIKEHLATAMNAGRDVAGIIEPRIAAEIVIGRVDEQIVQRGQSERVRQPAPAFQRIAEAVQDDE